MEAAGMGRLSHPTYGEKRLSGLCRNTTDHHHD
jgi:hypothetical protein